MPAAPALAARENLPAASPSCTLQCKREKPPLSPEQEGEAPPLSPEVLKSAQVAHLVKAQPCGVQGESHSDGSCPACAESLVFTGDSKGNVTLALALPWVKKAKPAGTVSPHCTTVNPAGQGLSELRSDTCTSGLCPPKAGSSLTSALMFLAIQEEAGLVVGSEVAH
ncbi:UNVERIFIED_CONTAM: hypothetical protein FKN15_016820 [Acipenser sinensis]